jgi:hypothetical protein
MNSDFLELLRALQAADARFLVVGAYAVAVHGHPRATGDLDVWVDATAENARKVFVALRSFGAPLADLAESDLAQPGLVFQMGRPPRRIDVITSASGISFEESWDHRVSARFGDLRCPVIGFDDLLVNKRATGRHKDLADAEALEVLGLRRAEPSSPE